MNTNQLTIKLKKYLNTHLAKDLIVDFVNIKNECKTGTLGKVSIGKFIETVVQLLQYLETGKYDKKPSVDDYLRNLESRSVANIDDDLRIVCSRIARSAYTLRNKRNIAHKGSVDPNIYDLRYVFASSQWILSEIVRQVIQTDMKTAGELIEYIQIPISSVIEDLGKRKLIFGNFTVNEEIMVLLYSYYPSYVSRNSIKESLDRRSNSSISNSLSKLWNNKLVHRDGSEYKLTQEGFKETIKILQK